MILPVYIAIAGFGLKRDWRWGIRETHRELPGVADKEDAATQTEQPLNFPEAPECSVPTTMPDSDKRRPSFLDL
jgi:hypothetical protein